MSTPDRRAPPSRRSRKKRGVCRDYAHLAVAFCRCLNIPTRYCTGYITDIGLPPPYAPMDFSAWIEVYLGGRWHAFDPRNNAPRVGRILIAHGRDAADVPLTHSFGPNILSGFRVWADEAPAAWAPAIRRRRDDGAYSVPAIPACSTILPQRAISC